MDCDFNGERIEAFTMLFDDRALSHLKVLYITFGNIGFSGAKILASALQHVELKELKLEQTKLGIVGVGEFVRTLKCLHYLDIQGNNIGEGARNLFLGFKDFVTLQKLDLSRNEISSDGAAALADAWQSGCPLERLILSFNNICCEGAIALASLCQSGSKLRDLELSNNKIGLCGASVLLLGTRLKFLYLSYNMISCCSPLCINCFTERPTCPDQSKECYLVQASDYGDGIVHLDHNNIDADSAVSVLHELGTSNFNRIDLSDNNSQMDNQTLLCLKNALQAHKNNRSFSLHIGTRVINVQPNNQKSIL